MSREDAQFKLRLPEDLRDQISEAAARNGRSMNAEVVSRLAASFEGDQEAKLEKVMERVLSRYEAALRANVIAQTGLNVGHKPRKGKE